MKAIDAGTIGDIKYIESAFLTSDYNLSNIRMRREKVDKFASALLIYDNGVRAAFSSGMNLETEKDHRHDRLYIYGTKGYVKSDVEYNQAGELSFRVCVDSVETLKKVTVPQNYSLEISQLGRCILDGEKTHVSKEFSIMNANVLGQVLDVAGY